ncbi:MAG TPA: MFS transporter, partial [Spirochaetota bacterium]|nr:MFS transporter [Spirochaetota bacterium]
MVAFLPIYLSEKGFSIGRSGNLLFLMLAAGAAGGLIGGFISDRWSRRGVLRVSLLLAAVFFMLFLKSSGTLSFVLLGLAGACLLGSFSVTVVMAQTILPHGAATASGLMLGLGTGIGGLGVGILGHAAGVYGAGRIVMILALVPAAAGIISLTLGKSYEKDTSKSNTTDVPETKFIQGTDELPDAPNGLNER